MLAIFRKEITVFFSSLIGYITMGVFLIALGLFVWLFTESSVLQSGYANIDALFTTAPLILLFLIPAITMRSLAEENKNGTIELLTTRPLTDWQIITGKYLAALALYAISLLPTLVYYYSVYHLAQPVGNIDNGALIGSYFGLFMLGATFTAIGIFSSSLTSNQVVAFITALSFCFIMYMSFDYIAKLPGIFGKFDFYVQQIGINSHYTAVSYGVIDVRDVIYFLSVIVLFLFGTKTVMNSRKW
ncbi:MAG: gliding motility-associated transporter permease subunit GldF [Bacteroidota bacterium]|jgi:ABC-2 type transport system permease protein